MKDTVSRVTGPDAAATAAGARLARRVLAEGFEADADEPGATPTGRSADGRSRRWDAHRAARREELIDAAIEAIDEHGPDVGMEQVAATAHTSKPVIYRYFTDKTDLYRAVSQRVVGDVFRTLVEVATTNPSSRQIVRAGIDAYLLLLEQNPQLFRFVSAHPLVVDTTTGADVDFSTIMAELLAQHFRQELTGRGLDPALAHPWCEGVVAFIRAASLWWVEHRDAMDRAALAAYLGNVVWSGAAGLYGEADPAE